MDPDEIAQEIVNGNAQGQEPEVPGDEDEREESRAAEGEAPDDGEEGAEGPDSDVAEPARRPSRADARIQSLVRAREEDKRNFQRELDEVRQRLNQPQQRQESPEEESARMALMSPDERTDYRLNKADRQHREQMQAFAFQTAETADQSSFRTEIRANPALQRYEAEVEEVLAAVRRRGLNLPRMEVLHNVLGRATMAALGKKNGKQAERGARNISRQTTTPVNGRGDVQTQRRRGATSARERLEGVEI